MSFLLDVEDLAQRGREVLLIRLEDLAVCVEVFDEGQKVNVELGGIGLIGQDITVALEVFLCLWLAATHDLS